MRTLGFTPFSRTYRLTAARWTVPRSTVSRSRYLPFVSTVLQITDYLPFLYRLGLLLHIAACNDDNSL